MSTNIDSKMLFNSNSIDSIDDKLNELTISFGQKLATITADKDITRADQMKCLDQMRAQLDDCRALLAISLDQRSPLTPSPPISPTDVFAIDKPKKSYASVIHNDKTSVPITATQPSSDVLSEVVNGVRKSIDNRLPPNGPQKGVNNGSDVSTQMRKKRITPSTTPLKSIPKRDINNSFIETKNDNQNREKELRREIFGQFFSSHLPSLKETVDFVSDRITSKCIRNIRTDVYVKCKQSYNESIAINTSDNDFNTNELDIQCITSSVQNQCIAFVNDFCRQTDPQIHSILPFLVIEDIDDSVVTFAAKIATHWAIDKCIDWVQTNITQMLIEKDLKVQMKKKMLNRNKCPEPTTGQHMANIVDITPTFSSVRDLMADLYKQSDRSLSVDVTQLVAIIDDLSHLRRQTNILPKRTLDFIDVNIVDLSMALVANRPDLINEIILQRFVDYWTEFKITVEKYICPRNLYILSERSKCAIKCWNKYETILLKMLSKGITSHKIIESDCLWTLKQEWTDSTLNRLASCLKSVSSLKPNSTSTAPVDELGDGMDEYQTIEWLSWFCAQSDPS